MNNPTEIKGDQLEDPLANLPQECSDNVPSTTKSVANEGANEITPIVSTACVVHPADLDELVTKHILEIKDNQMETAMSSPLECLDNVSSAKKSETYERANEITSIVSTEVVVHHPDIGDLSSKHILEIKENQVENPPASSPQGCLDNVSSTNKSEANERAKEITHIVSTLCTQEISSSCDTVLPIDKEAPIGMECEVIMQPLILEMQSKSNEAIVAIEATAKADTDEVTAELSTATENISQTQHVSHSSVAQAPQVPNSVETAASLSIKQAIDIGSSRMQECLNGSGLSLLAAQYDSDSDCDDICEVPPAHIYQNRVVEIDSDSSSSDVEVLGEDRASIDLEILSTGQGDEDDEENIRNARPPKVKGELRYEDLPPIQDLHITVPEEECTELGKIHSIVEQLVLVNSLHGTVPVDLETVLFLDKGQQVLGEIFDVLGQVSDPLYCVRFNSNKEIKEKGIEIGQTVYVAPKTQHTQFIILANLMKMRGSDASWENDIEPPPRYLDYSDDEEEREARHAIRTRNRPVVKDEEEPNRQRYGRPPFAPRGRFPQSRPYRGHNQSPFVSQPHYQPPSNYDIAGNSWHSNYYQNFVNPHQQHQQYRMPLHPHYNYRVPPPNMTHQPPVPNTGMVLNPYAAFPPPLMQQPLFPPSQLPPPPPPGEY